MAWQLGIHKQVWIAPGSGLADDYLAALDSVAGSSEVTMTLILLVFAVAHSGLAGLRPYGESRLGGPCGPAKDRTNLHCGLHANHHQCHGQDHLHEVQ